MNEPLRTQVDHPQPARARRLAGGAPLMRVLATAQVLATVGLVAASTWDRRPAHPRALELLLGIVAVATAVWIALRCDRLLRGVGRIAALLTDVRLGREPVRSLEGFDAPLRELVSSCHDLAHDLRMERARTAELENEVRQRIANRTEALERKIGTLRQQAARDGLTGLFNRRSLDAYLPDAMQRCASSAMPLCVLMIDIDYFKPLNDTLGHAAGDQMLKAVAQIIRSTIRENDLAFRNGGDEFVVVLEECDAATGRVMADRLTALGDSMGRTFRLVPPPSLSIGLTTLADVKDATAPALLRRADEVLYQVKAQHHATAGHPRKSA